MINYEELIIELKKDDATKPRIFAIDGVAGSGKTYLAERLKGSFQDSQVIHMDDLYRGWNNPFSDDLINRTLEQVINPFKNQQIITFQKFNWAINDFDQSIIVKPSQILFLEGVGAGQLEFRKYLSKIVWVEFDVTKGLERVIARDGQGVRNEMEQFLIDQNKHFATELTKKVADYAISGVA